MKLFNMCFIYFASLHFLVHRFRHVRCILTFNIFIASQSDAIARLLSNRAQIAGSDSDSSDSDDSDSDDSYF